MGPTPGDHARGRVQGLGIAGLALTGVHQAMFHALNVRTIEWVEQFTRVT